MPYIFNIFYLYLWGGGGKLEFNMSSNNKYIKIIDIFWGAYSLILMLRRTLLRYQVGT